MRVKDPGGTTWRVSRRWAPWRRKLSGFGDSVPGFDIPLGDDPISMIIGLILMVILIPFVILAVVVGLELLLLLLLIPVAALTRVLFGRKWTVEVRQGWTPYYEEVTGTWNDAQLRIHQLAADLEHGVVPPHTLNDKPPEADAASPKDKKNEQTG